MAVITSTRLEASPQIDGRISVRELHQADGGESEIRSYVALATDDLDAMLTANGQQFLARLATVVVPTISVPSVLVESTPPTDAVGQSGDMYLNSTTGDFYVRA